MAEVKGPPSKVGEAFRQIRTRTGSYLAKVGNCLSHSHGWTVSWGDISPDAAIVALPDGLRLVVGEHLRAIQVCNAPASDYDCCLCHASNLICYDCYHGSLSGAVTAAATADRCLPSAVHGPPLLLSRLLLLPPLLLPRLLLPPPPLLLLPAAAALATVAVAIAATIRRRCCRRRRHHHHYCYHSWGRCQQPDACAMFAY